MNKVKPNQHQKLNRLKKAKIKFRHKHPIITSLFILTLLSISILTIAISKYVSSVVAQTPIITEKQLMSESTSNMYDIHGNKIWSETESRRDYVKLENVPKTYIDLLLSVEDSEFYNEKGVSKSGIFNAFYSTFMSKLNKDVEARGGSTIDQQLLKNSSEELVNKSTIERKLMEWWRAYQMNENFTKDQILEYYINKIYLGEFSYGSDTIAMTYYGVHLQDLAEPTIENLSKLAIIAGLGQSPSKYNLYDNPELVRRRREEVTLSAVRKGKLTEAQRKEISKIDVTLGLKDRYWRNSEIQNQVKTYNAYIDSTLKQLQAQGYDYKKSPIQIYTYLDPEKQNWLASQINNPQYYQNDGQQVAVTVTDVQTGIVLAQSGGRNEEAFGLNRATQRTRSSGSSTKPFISYGPAVEYFGYGSHATFDSSNYVYPGTNVIASNYGGYTYGRVTMSYALQMSLNTPALRVLDEVVGSQYAKDFLSRNGLDVKDYYGGSDALGINVSTEQEASAFAAIANGGIYRKPTYIKSLTFADGSSKELTIEENRSMKESTAFILEKMLEQTMLPNSSAPQAKIDEFAGHFVKTGTVGYDNDGIWRPEFSSSDKWVSGATKSIAISIWTGYDSPNEVGNWLLEDNKGYMYLYTTLMRYFNSGRDTSAYQQPSTVGGSNLQLLPLDTKPTSSTLRPDILTIENDSNVYGVETTKKSKIIVEQKDTIQKAPTDYQYQSWANTLSEEDKKLKQKWDSNRQATPDINDVVDKSTVYDNSR